LEPLRLPPPSEPPRHSDRRNTRCAGGREIDLIYLVRQVLDGHEAANARNNLSLHVGVDDRERLEPHTLERRRVSLVTPDRRPIAEHSRRPRAANRLLG